MLLRFTGNAFAGFQQFSKVERKDVSRIRDSFGTDPFGAYDHFVFARRLNSSESLDVDRYNNYLFVDQPFCF